MAPLTEVKETCSVSLSVNLRNDPKFGSSLHFTSCPGLLDPEEAVWCERIGALYVEINQISTF